MAGATIGFVRRQAEIPPLPTYRRSRLALNVVRLGTAQDFHDALRNELVNEAQEVVMVAAIEDGGQVRDVVEVGRGGYHSVVVPIPALLAVPLLAGTDYVVIAHNHPSGRLTPSAHDFQMTDTITKAVNTAGLILYDHLIFVPNGSYISLRESHAMPKTPSDPAQIELQA